ncbi:Homeobox-leucine zipper protein HOX27 [Hibiscus syriacus]|uniref:Homeobox-leucine zipper protein HOX27 n=1 Tax=Hibiscus syriacus TaxID=106335 RepID=A0A6A3BF03_HIBSY|nr:homeobox-leucine zipper protein HAT22-like [Hibiscus syriacus]KAE8715616.1 Homeobox-leucine zipper protein HOX27 [Hibiscus syriacus]
MGLDDVDLFLGLGRGCLVKQESFSPWGHHQQKKKKSFLKHDQFLPSLSLGPSHGMHQSFVNFDGSEVDGESIDLHQRQAYSLSPSAVSSFSNSSVKRERDLGGEEVGLERVSSRVSDGDEEGSPRKKLRLRKEQSAILEESFKEHSTLNPKQKQTLAEQLNLRPRQVEVWFQNRRARTKLKQTEVDCELLKKCCETLTEENKRLHKELQELKSLKLTASYCMQLPAATLTICPSCEKVDNGSEGPSASSTFTIGQKSHFYTHPSAAC